MWGAQEPFYTLKDMKADVMKPLNELFCPDILPEAIDCPPLPGLAQTFTAPDLPSGRSLQQQVPIDLPPTPSFPPTLPKPFDTLCWKDQEQPSCFAGWPFLLVGGLFCLVSIAFCVTYGVVTTIMRKLQEKKQREGGATDGNVHASESSMPSMESMDHQVSEL